VRVAYVNHAYPQLTQTFVYREVRALRGHGVDVVPLSFKRPARIVDSAELADEAARTVYLPSPRSAAFWLAAALAFLRHPLAALRCLALPFAPDGNPHARRSLPALALDFARGLYLARFLARHPEIDHVHAPFSTEVANSVLVATRLTGARASFRNHTCFDAAFVREKLAACRFALSISAFDRDLLLAYAGGAHAGKIEVVHCGIDPDAWPPAPVVREPRIVSVGSLAPKKGHSVLVRACRLLADRGVGFRCDIAGGGPLRAELDALVRELGLADRVVLRGPLPQEEVRRLMADARAFVLASVPTEDGDLDGIPVVLMEAMALGKACVATRLSGIPELIADGQTGLLAEPGDAHGLAERIARALADDALAARLAAAAPRAVADRFHLGTETRRLKEIFERRG
jgi:glycosyltransferase involved in cell wall biosynthesis